MPRLQSAAFFMQAGFGLVLHHYFTGADIIATVYKLVNIAAIG